MKITVNQLRKIIAEEVTRYTEARGGKELSLDVQPLLDLFDVYSLEDLADQDLIKAYKAIDAIKTVYDMRKADKAGSKGLESRLKPMDAAAAKAQSGMSAKQAKDFADLYEFFAGDDGRVFAINPSLGTVYAQSVGPNGKLQKGDLKKYGPGLDLRKLGFKGINYNTVFGGDFE